MFPLKGLKLKNKGHTKFYECCDLTEKVYLFHPSEISCFPFFYFFRLIPLYVDTEVMLPPLVQFVFPNIWKLLLNHLNLKIILVEKQLDVISDVTKIGLKKTLVQCTKRINKIILTFLLQYSKN